MTTKVAIIGAGDLGRTLSSHIRDYPDMRLVGFFDDVVERGHAVADDASNFGPLSEISQKYESGLFESLVMGIGYKHLGLRMSLFSRFRCTGIPFTTLIHPSCFVHRTASVGEGAILFPRCVLDSSSTIQVNTLLNTGCIVAHDTEVGRGTFMGPGVTLSGFVKIGSECFIGTGTIVRDNINVGDRARTGAGAVVVRDIPEGTLVVGVPARPVIKGSAVSNGLAIV